MAYVRNDSRIKLIPEGHVLHVPVLCHGVFLHAMRVRCGYWRGRMVAAWRELSPDSRVQQILSIVLPRNQRLVGRGRVSIAVAR